MTPRPLSFRDNRYFITPNRRHYILSLTSDNQTYAIRFQSKYYTGELIIDKATYYPIHFEEQLIKPYNQDLLICICVRSVDDLNYFQQEYIRTIDFTTNTKGKLYMTSYIEQERVDPLIYNIGKIKNQKEYALSFTKNFSMQLVE